VPRDRPWASEAPLTDSQLDWAVDGLTLARSWSLGSRKGRKAAVMESGPGRRPQEGAEGQREAEARLLCTQLAVVEAAAESRLCTALASLSAREGCRGRSQVGHGCGERGGLHS